MHSGASAFICICELACIAIAVFFVWYIYDRVIAEHWQVVVTDPVAEESTLSGKYRTKDLCKSGAALEASQNPNFEYQCGYDCKKLGSIVICEEYE